MYVSVCVVCECERIREHGAGVCVCVSLWYVSVRGLGEQVELYVSVCVVLVGV